MSQNSQNCSSKLSKRLHLDVKLKISSLKYFNYSHYNMSTLAASLGNNFTVRLHSFFQIGLANLEVCLTARVSSIWLLLKDVAAFIKFLNNIYADRHDSQN